MAVDHYTFPLSIVLAAFVISCDREPISAPRAINYYHAGCYGSCPAFTIEVDRRGRGTFEGRAYTPAHGKRSFAVTPQQFDAFAKALEPARLRAKPLNLKKNVVEESNVDFRCPPSAPNHTDDTGVLVMWLGSQDLYFDAYYGCDAERNKEHYEALDRAPDKLGLGKMIGPHSP